MPKPSPAVASRRASRAALSRHYSPDDPRAVEAARELKVANADDYLARILADDPHLTTEQIRRLRDRLDEAVLADVA